jgi:hypothetical protein
MKFSVTNDTNLKINKEIGSLLSFAKKRFGFKNNPKVILKDDPDNAVKVLGKTAYYDPSSQEVYLYVTQRHPKDVLRSLAHELVHHTQNENGQFDTMTNAGQGYAQKDPHLRKMEADAYIRGNLCFRDWEDGLKEEQPTIYNERRNQIMSLKEWKNNELGDLLTNRWGFKMDLSNLNEGDDKDGPPDEDEDGVPDYADKKPGKDDHAEDEEESEEESDEKESGEKKKFKPKKGVLPPQFKKKK